MIVALVIINTQFRVLDSEITFPLFYALEVCLDKILNFGIGDFGNFVLNQVIADEFCDGRGVIFEIFLECHECIWMAAVQDLVGFTE